MPIGCHRLMGTLRFAHPTPTLNSEVAELAVAIRRDSKIRLPDAIIWASAKSEDALLVSRNSKDFPPEAPDVRMPYLV